MLGKCNFSRPFGHSAFKHANSDMVFKFLVNGFDEKVRLHLVFASDFGVANRFHLRKGFNSFVVFNLVCRLLVYVA